jgi:hypothetical protein
MKCSYRLRYAVLLVLVGGCSTHSKGNNDLGDNGTGDLALSGTADLATNAGVDLAGADLASPAGLAAIKNVWTIVLENHDYKEIVSTTANDGPAMAAPYINSLINTYGLATNYKDSGTHPSLPNYLYMTSGSVQGTSSDINPPNPGFDSDNVGNQLTTAMIPWRAYLETMSTACNLDNSGVTKYAAKHNPFVYYKKIQNDATGLCSTVDVDYGAHFATDLSAGTYRYMWISPDLTDDGHGWPVSLNPTTELTDSDNWCMHNIPAIINSAAFKSGGVIFLTWDEAEGRNGDDADQIPMVVIASNIVSKGFKSATAYTHASYLATVEKIFGLPRLGDAATAATMDEFFK